MVTAPRPRLLTAQEVADELNVHVYTVYQLLKAGRLGGSKIRTHWRVKREELDRFVQISNNNKEN